MPVKTNEFVWQVYPKNKELAQTLGERLNTHPVVAQILLNRDIRSLEEASFFLNPLEKDAHSSFPEKDIALFCELLSDAVKQKKRIFLVGDYDVDGMTSTSIMAMILREQGAEYAYYIPHRFSEGYGLNKGIMDIVIQQKCDLLITLDCGIKDHVELAYLRKRSDAKIILVDHHTMPKELPTSDLIINPKTLDKEHAYYDLCTAGIVYKIMGAYLDYCKSDLDINAYSDLAALGTVADVVPLKGENRVIVCQGLKRLGQRQNIGVKALLDVAKMESPTISSIDIGFRIAPRLNAAGRLLHAKEGVELLISTDNTAAYKQACRLDKLNLERREVGERMLTEAKEMIEQDPSQLEDNIIVLSSPLWHSGVIGITAAQLVKAYKVPAVLMAEDGSIARGSARTVPGVSCYDVLEKCQDYFEGFGGHKEAAGFSIEPSKIPEFKQALRSVARTTIQAKDLRYFVDIDCILGPEELNLNLVRQIESLHPFGQGNPMPVFYTNKLRAIEFKTVGNGTHVKATFSDKSGKILVDAIGFGLADKMDLLYKDTVELAFHLDVNSWMGRDMTQLTLVDIK